MRPHKNVNYTESDSLPASAAQRILVVDDEPDIRSLLQEILEDEGYLVEVAENGKQAKLVYRQHKPDLVLLDIWMPDVDGITLLKDWLEEGNLPMPVIMMSGHGTVETAVEATRLGAFDFIEKPLSLAKLLLTVEQALESNKARRDLSSQRRTSLTVSEPIGRSPVMQRLREQIKRIAEHDSWVLINGESGSGTHVAARFLHDCSIHHDMPFVEINLSSKDHNKAIELLGSEHGDSVQQGLMEQANGGTLFLRNIDEADDEMQNILLSVLQSEAFQRIGGTRSIPFKARVVCSAHSDLEYCIELGTFRKDLFYLINVVPLYIPPLREHREDIPELINFYTNIYVDQEKLPYRRFSLAAQNRLRNYDWPGNIRELMNIIQRLLVTAAGAEISLEEVETALSESDHKPVVSQGISIAYDLPLREAREQFERDYFLYQLQRTGGSVGKVAKIVGIERTHLYRKLRALGIDPKSLPAQNNE